MKKLLLFWEEVKARQDTKAICYEHKGVLYEDIVLVKIHCEDLIEEF